MTKRPSLFSTKLAPAETEIGNAANEAITAEAPSSPAPAPLTASEPPTRAAYPKASTRAGKRVVTAYVSPEAFRQLKRIAADEDAQVQDLLTEGLNAVFAARGLSRIA